MDESSRRARRMLVSSGRGSRRACGRRLVDDFSADHGEQYFSFADERRLDVKQILRHENHVGNLARLEGSFGFFAVPGDGCAESVALDGVRKTDALLRQPTSGRIPVSGLASYRILNSFPGIERDHRPIASEGQDAAGALDALPGEAALRTLWSGVARPDLEYVVVGISMERLKTGDDAQLSEAFDVIG